MTTTTHGDVCDVFYGGAACCSRVLWLVQVSGVGARSHVCGELGLELVAEADGVGRNLMDHLEVRALRCMTCVTYVIRRR